MELNLQLLEQKEQELLKSADQLRANLTATQGALQMLKHLKEELVKEVQKVEDKVNGKA